MGNSSVSGVRFQGNFEFYSREQSKFGSIAKSVGKRWLIPKRKLSIYRAPTPTSFIPILNPFHRDEESARCQWSHGETVVVALVAVSVVVVVVIGETMQFGHEQSDFTLKPETRNLSQAMHHFWMWNEASYPLNLKRNHKIFLFLFIILDGSCANAFPLVAVQVQ